VLVVQEIFGVHEHIKDVCRRFAKKGYLAIAPDLYVRQGDVSKLTAFPEILKIVNTVPDAQVLADLDATGPTGPAATRPSRPHWPRWAAVACRRTCCMCRGSPPRCCLRC